MIFISTAHSRKSKGAVNSNYHINEYDISKQASYACFELLTNNGYACTLSDCGNMSDHEYSIYKSRLINSVNPQPELALEIHLNSSIDKEASYGEVIYRESTKSYITKTVAESITDSLNDGFMKCSHPLKYKNRGAQATDKHLFFVDDIKCPSIIVEGLFISNDDHAAWVKNNGAQAYGTLVGNGILNWLKRVE